MMLLEDLLNTDRQEDRNREIRRRFSGIKEAVEVEHQELQCLIILINLTLKREQVSDLCDIETAKRRLSSRDFLVSCLNTVLWYHSHNLKYPDARVSLQRLIAQPQPIIPGLVTGEGEARRIDWSHNSNEVNQAKLFSASFVWRGNLLCLAEVLLTNPSRWLNAFKRLGVLKETMDQAIAYLKDSFPEESFPDMVSTWTPQLLMPYQGEYLSISPVVNVSLQSKIQQLSFDGQCRNLTIKHMQPSSISGLVAALGGHVRVISSHPSVPVFQTGATNSNLKFHGAGLFNYQVLHRKEFTSELNELLTDDCFNSQKKREIKRKTSLRVIRLHLLEWISPLIEIHSEHQSGAKKIEGLLPLEEQLLALDLSQWIDFLKPINLALHEGLQKFYYSRKFAFHPDLMVVLKSELAVVLKYIATPPDTMEKITEGHFYIHLKGLRAQQISSLSCPYLAGIPSMTSAWGLTHQFQRQITSMLGTPTHVAGFALFLRSFSPLQEQVKLGPDLIRHKRKTLKTCHSPLINGRRADLTLDIVLAIEMPYMNIYPVEMDTFIDQVRAAVPSRYAGGVLLPTELTDEDYPDWCRIYSDPQELFKRLIQLPATGKWITPIEAASQDIKSLLELCNENTFYRLASVGFQLLEDPKKRIGSCLPLHAYAQTGLGVVNCLSPMHYRYCGVADFYREAFWQLDVQKRSMIMGNVNVWDKSWNFADS